MPEPQIPSEILLGKAARTFIEATSTESAEHIKPLHRYLAVRFVLEGGFQPIDLMPRPPLSSDFRGGKWYLSFDPGSKDEKEQVVLGALKSKRIDLVASKKGIGPVLAVSVKGTSRAFRNLVNRTLDGLTGRRLIRDDYARYEAVGLALLKAGLSKRQNPLLDVFPPPESSLNLDTFFATLYRVYDLRYPYTYTDPSLGNLVRVEWHAESPALLAIKKMEASGERLGYSVRTAGS